MFLGDIAFPILLICIIVASCIFVHYFGDFKKIPLFTIIWLIASLSLCLSQLALLPVDFNNYLYNRCQAMTNQQCTHFSNSYMSNSILKIIWNVVYWTNFVNIWFELFTLTQNIQFIYIFVNLGYLFHSFKNIMKLVDLLFSNEQNSPLLQMSFFTL